MSWERSHLQPAVVDKALIVCLLRQTQYRTPLLEAEVAVERLSFVAEIWIELKLVVHAHHTRLLQQRLGEEEAHGSERVTHPLILTNGDQVVYADKADVRLVELSEQLTQLTTSCWSRTTSTMPLSASCSIVGMATLSGTLIRALTRSAICARAEPDRRRSTCTVSPPLLVGS